jgi:integrase/recombinase XerD
MIYRNEGLPLGPTLSTYLGHVELKATQRHLTMTPELLREANGRFESYVLGQIQ